MRRPDGKQPNLGFGPATASAKGTINGRYFSAAREDAQDLFSSGSAARKRNLRRSALQRFGRIGATATVPYVLN